MKKKQRDWYYRELFRFLLKLGVVRLEHGMPMKYYASYLYAKSRGGVK